MESVSSVGHRAALISTKQNVKTCNRLRRETLFNIREYYSNAHARSLLTAVPPGSVHCRSAVLAPYLLGPQTVASRQRELAGEFSPARCIGSVALVVCSTARCVPHCPLPAVPLPTEPARLRLASRAPLSRHRHGSVCRCSLCCCAAALIAMLSVVELSCRWSAESDRRDHRAMRAANDS